MQIDYTNPVLAIPLLYGIYAFSKCLYRFLSFWVLTLCGILFPTNLHIFGGNYVLITGGSDGIGKEYAKRFAAKGLNLLLVARNPRKLNNVRTEILNIYPKITIKICSIDFSKTDDGIYKFLAKEIENIEIGILVNNVGIGYEVPARLHEIDDEYADKMINNLVNVNCRAQVNTSRVVLPQMVKRRNGLIINISSLSSRALVPMGAVYGAAKCFNEYISECLRYEYQSHNIKVQTVVPGFICTKLINGLMKPSIRIPTAETFVKHAFRTIGYQNSTFGYWHHHFQGFMASINKELSARLACKGGEIKRKLYFKKKGKSE